MHTNDIKLDVHTLNLCLEIHSRLSDYAVRI